MSRRRKKPILGYVPKNNEKKNSALKGLNNVMILIHFIAITIFPMSVTALVTILSLTILSNNSYQAKSRHFMKKLSLHGHSAWNKKLMHKLN